MSIKTPRIVTTVETIKFEPFTVKLSTLPGGLEIEDTLEGTATFNVTWSYDLFEGAKHPDDPAAKNDFRWEFKDLTFHSFESKVTHRMLTNFKQAMINTFVLPEISVTIDKPESVKKLISLFEFEAIKHVDTFDPPTL